jgi:ubiquinone/menaquinone biosynthesis C-methylase UbiE
MTFYSRRVLPWVIDKGMRNKAMTRYRPRIPPLATGRVLEIGTGAGRNFPYYTSAVEHLFGLEPADYLRGAAAVAAEPMPFPVTLMASGAESIPMASGSLDTVLSTWTFCSIPGLESALLEIRRVLKPGGRLLFLEHGRSPDADVARLQQRLTPAFTALAGCRLDRNMSQFIDDAGFRITDLDTCYLEGPRFVAYHYIGSATPR